MPDQELLAYLAMLVKWGETVDLNMLMVWPVNQGLTHEIKVNTLKLLHIYTKGLDLFECDKNIIS